MSATRKPVASKQVASARLRLDALQLRELAVAAECDPRTVAKYIARQEVQPIQRRRIESALRKTARDHLIWPTQPIANPTTTEKP